MSRAPATIRRARAGDHPAVLALLVAAGLPTEGVAESLTGFAVAENDAGTIVGAAAIEAYGDKGLVRSVVVDSSIRGTGLGQSLTEHVIAGAEQRGITDLYLLTTTAEDFFPRFGFHPVTREAVPDSVLASVEFRGACPDSAVIMHRAAPARPLRVLFLCTGNSARSQIAEAVMNQKGAGRFAAESAGSHPAPTVNPHAVAILEEHGYSVTGRAPRGLDGLERGNWDFVITVCDRAREACPLFPGQPVVAHWGLPDPAEARGTEQEIRRSFLDAFLVLSRRIDLFLALPAETLSRMALEQRVRAIGQA